MTIDKSSGRKTKLGKSFARNSEFDVMGGYVKFPNIPRKNFKKEKKLFTQ